VFSKLKPWVLSGALCAGAPTMPVFAASDAPILEEITVTAQKRAQSAQDIGIAVTAFTGDNVRELGLQKPVDLAAQTPGLYIKNTFAGAGPIFTVRGVGNSAWSTNTVSPVATYVDEIFLASNTQLGFSLFDLERVEVLKGPQGTLFGRNTTGGAVSFVTKRPGRDAEGFVSVSIGDYEVADLEFGHSTGVTDNLSARIAGKLDYRGEGFFTNRLNGGDDDVGREENWALRLGLLWELESLDIYWNIHGGRDDSEAEPWVGIGQADPASALPNPELPTGIETRASCGDPAIQPIEFFMRNCSNRVGYRDPFIDPREGEFSADAELENDAWGSLLNVEWETGFGTLTSITAIEQKDNAIGDEFDGSPFVMGDGRYENDMTAFSQEVRLTSREPAFGRMDWITGGMYYTDEMTVNDLYIYQDRLNHDILVRFDQESTSWALFAHTETPLTENTRIVAGLRYSDDKTAFDGGTFLVNLAPDFNADAANNTTFVDDYQAFPGLRDMPNLADDDTTSSEFTGKLGIEYQPGGNLLLYASYSRGYKSGIWYGVWADPYSAHEATEPEFVNAWEVGYKATLSGGRLQLNGAAYLYDYRDIQLFATVGNRFSVFNAGEADIRGAELEFRWAPLVGLTLGGGLAYTDSEVTSEELGYRSAQAAQAPEFTVNLDLRFHWPVTDALDAFLNTDLAWQDRVYFTLDNFEAWSQEAYTVVNASVGVASADDVWRLKLWAKNLTDRDYFTEILPSGSAEVYSALVGEPRTYGVNFTYHW